MHDGATDMPENGAGLLIGGLVPFSTVDWPGKLVAVVFTRGCPWNCSYCHNPHLLATDTELEIGTVHPGAAAYESPAPVWTDILTFLDTRQGLLDGVVFSGGEPTLQPELPAAIRDVRSRGFEVALHTNGAYPERFHALLPLTDWIGLDIKAPFDVYERVARAPRSGERAFKSLAALVSSDVPFEVRTTWHPDLLGAQDLITLAGELENAGVTRWAIQAYRDEGTRPTLRRVRPSYDNLPDRVRAFKGNLIFREA